MRGMDMSEVTNCEENGTRNSAPTKMNWNKGRKKKMRKIRNTMSLLARFLFL
jgi:hypothetical protein